MKVDSQYRRGIAKLRDSEVNEGQNILDPIKTAFSAQRARKKRGCFCDGFSGGMARLDLKDGKLRRPRFFACRPCSTYKKSGYETDW